MSPFLELFSRLLRLAASLFTSVCWLSALRTGGDDGIRTHDPLLAGQVLSQLSYTPMSACCLSSFLCLFSFLNELAALRLLPQN